MKKKKIKSALDGIILNTKEDYWRYYETIHSQTTKALTLNKWKKMYQEYLEKNPFGTQIELANSIIKKCEEEEQKLSFIKKENDEKLDQIPVIVTRFENKKRK